MQQRPQLDTLRAFAVMSVIAHHVLHPRISYGHLGVRLFFVLSGFLITGILLESKARVEQPRGPESRGFVLRQFYARRALRIFPAYYMLLLLYHLCGVDLGRSTGFHLSYTSNIWFSITNSWVPYVTAHFWSLSIEEQFYLFWPVVVLWVPRRYLGAAILCLAASGPLFRSLLLAASLDDLRSVAAADGMRQALRDTVALWTWTPASFDALGMGAFLALVHGTRGEKLLRRIGLLAIVLVAAIAVLMESGAVQSPFVPYVIGELLSVVAFAAVVSMAANGVKGPAGALLNLRPLRYLGRISYGVYLYHLPVVMYLWALLSRWPRLAAQLAPPPIWLTVVTAVTIALASLSWYLLEAPLNRLKRHFPYARIEEAPSRSPEEQSR